MRRRRRRRFRFVLGGRWSDNRAGVRFCARLDLHLPLRLLVRVLAPHQLPTEAADALWVRDEAVDAEEDEHADDPTRDLGREGPEVEDVDPEAVTKGEPHADDGEDEHRDRVA